MRISRSLWSSSSTRSKWSLDVTTTSEFLPAQTTGGAKSKRAACRQIASSRSGGFKLIERALWRARRTKLGALSSENTVLAEPTPRTSPTSGRSFSIGAPVCQFGQALSASVIWAKGGPSCVATICIQSPTKRCKAQIIQRLKTGRDP